MATKTVQRGWLPLAILGAFASLDLFFLRRPKLLTLSVTLFPVAP